MKRNSLHILCLLFLLFASNVRAQEPILFDSIIVMGTVVDHLTDEPQPYCLLQFIRGEDTVSTVRCDEEGSFASDRLAVGAYTLRVTIKEQPVYQSDLVLNDNAALHIAVITDNFTLRNLKPVEVIALRHLLGPLQIASKKDTRLWDFCYRGTPWELKRDGNAAVATPNTLHPLYGDNPCTEGGSSCNPYVAKAYLYYNQSHGLEVSPFNSAMKNELLSNGRILDTKRPAPSDSTQSKK